MTVSLILGGAALFGLYILVLMACWRRSYKRGYNAGYEKGRVAGDNWWIRAESEVDQARVKIWRGQR